MSSGTMLGRLRGLFGPSQTLDARLGEPLAAPDINDAALFELLAAGLPGALRAEGDLHVAGSLDAPRGVVVTGSLHLAPGAELAGPAEVFGDVAVGAGARCLRPLVVHGAMWLAEDASTPSCRVSGDVHLAPGARVAGELRCGRLFLAAAPLERREGAPRTMLVRSRPAE